MGGPEDSPGRWTDLDRTGLISLLSSGLTPAQIGARYGRSANTVRLKARAWNVDTRALRARAHGLARGHPDLAAEFVCVVDGAPLAYGASDLARASGARCQWRCLVCDHEWVTSVANRTIRRSGCPRCAQRRGTEIAQARTARTESLSVDAADLATEFVANLARPDRDITTTPSGSHDRVLWRCRSGHEWEAEARQRVKYKTQCPVCRSGLWTSRLEFEVGELVEVASGMTVTVGARLSRNDRATDERIDLLVDAADLLVDLDPTRWHSAASAMERDARKLDRLAGERYVRVRPRHLGRLPVERADSGQQVFLAGSSERDPWLWASAVVEALQHYSPDVRFRIPSPSEQAAARARADVRWRRLRAAPRPRSLQSEHPQIADEFVTALGRAELSAADLAPASDDRVRWRCSECGHQWEARVANRTVGRTGCPPCSYRRGAALSARPRPGQSFADVHPTSAALFLENLTNPGTTPTDLRPNSTDRCRWTCQYCRRPRVATPHAVNRHPSSGCRECGWRRGIEKRRRRTS